MKDLIRKYEQKDERFEDKKIMNEIIANESIDDCQGFIYVVGIGPGKEDGITKEAERILEECDIIAGYKTYIAQVRDRFPDKEFFENGMTEELERCRKCIEFARYGKKVALIGSGDSGVYGMASPMLEEAARNGFKNIKVIPGVTAALSGGAILGAPIGHDFCLISLSDRLTSWELIEKRLKLAAEGDFVIVLYNPSSHKRKDYLKKACEILLEILPETISCAVARNIGREGEATQVMSLLELRDTEVDMFSTVFIGNSQTKIIDNYLVTPRGYKE